MNRRDERPLLDTVRWISAAMVAFGHTWTAVADPHASGPLAVTLRTLADLRHSWVIIFFGLSGYLIAGGTMLRWERFEFRRYALARFSRIYIVLLPALALTAALDGTAHLLAPHSPIYAGAWGGGVFGDAPPFARYTPKEVVASLLSLESVVAAPIGSDGPLWSLGFEWVFYFTFPALLLAVDAVAGRLGWPAWTCRGLALLTTVGLLVAAHKPYAALLWAIWIAGGLAHVVAETRPSSPRLRWGGALLCLIGFGLAFRVNYRFADALIGFGFALFLSRFPVGERGIAPALDRRLSSGAYSLYVTHLPVVAFLCLLFSLLGGLTPSGVSLGPAVELALVFGSAVALVAIAFQGTFEARTDILRVVLQRVMERLQPRRPRVG